MPTPRQPTLVSERLRLRPFRVADAKDVQRLAGARAVADTTLNIPHPYRDGQAKIWIRAQPEQFALGTTVVFAITLAADDALVGAIALALVREHARAELGYWIGKPYWGQGYATEAGHALLRYAFGELGLNRIRAECFARNPASGKVLRKLGMVHEGGAREHVRKWDVFEDVEWYGIRRAEYLGR